jgi:hypothetical protein
MTRKPFTFEERFWALVYAEGRCGYCRVELTPTFKDGLPYQLDHKIPLSRGGEHVQSNWMASCRSCNAEKGTKTDFEFICKQEGFEVGWYARANPDHDRDFEDNWSDQVSGYDRDDDGMCDDEGLICLDEWQGWDENEVR